MELRLQIIIGILIILALTFIYRLVKNRRVELKYMLSWIIVLGAIFIVNCFPAITNKVAGFIGIYTPINMLFFLGFCFSLCIIFGLTVTVSRLSNKVKKLTQEVALIQKEKDQDGK